MSAQVPTNNLHIRGTQDIGRKLSSAFPLFVSLRHNKLFPKVGCRDNLSSPFKILDDCSAALSCRVLSFFNQIHAHNLCHAVSSLVLFLNWVDIIDGIVTRKICCWLPVSFLFFLNHSASQLCSFLCSISRFKISSFQGSHCHNLVLVQITDLIPIF